jgi:hypothetical protein
MYFLWEKKQPTRCRERWYELHAVRTIVREARPILDTADTTVTSREEDADASRAELGKQVAYSRCIVLRDRLLVIAI